MPGAFFGLDLAARALMAQQLALDVTNHNVANANTKGFSRQNIAMQTTTPYTLPGMNMFVGPGQIGTGVSADLIQRTRDIFLDIQYRDQVGGFKKAESSLNALEEVELVFNEPSDTGLASQLAEHFRLWEQLADDPAAPAVRSALVQQSLFLASAFNRITTQITSVQSTLNAQVQDRVAAINDITSRIATLNGQIVQAEVSGQHANDFRDQRDLLIDELSGYVQVSVIEQPNGSVTINAGAQSLVTNVTTDPLIVTATGPGGRWEVKFSSNNALVPLGNAELAGIIAVRDTNIPNYLAQINSVANRLITAVNGLHTTGYGLDGVNGRPFFAGTDATNIAVDPAIVADPDRVAARDTATGAGNNAIALAIAQLRHTMSPTLETEYGTLISGLGVDTRSTRDVAANQEALVGLLERRRQSISGVSLDESAVDLLRYQKAYQAAARMITAQDQILETLMSTGLVGR